MRLEGIKMSLWRDRFSFRNSIYWLFYGPLSITYVLIMSFECLELRHRFRGIPPSSDQTLVIKLVPGLVLILLGVSIVVFVDFVRY